MVASGSSPNTSAGQTVRSDPHIHSRGGIGQVEDKLSGVEEGKKGQRQPGQCLPKSSATPKLIIKSDGLVAHIQYMKDHVLIAKFISIWPMEKTLGSWINTYSKPRGGFDLRFGAKGFFTIMFYNVEDKNKVFDDDPYFLNLAGLYLTYWQERFNPDRVDLLIAPVWL